MSHLPQAVVERRVAPQVGERPGTQVGAPQGGQDANKNNPPAQRTGRICDAIQQHAQFTAQGGKRAPGEAHRGGVQLQVEAIQLHGDPGSADAARTAWLRGRGRPA